MGAEVHELDRGLRLLAWPFWATAPLVQARRTPPYLFRTGRHPSVHCSLLLETNTEAKDAVAGTRRVMVALSRTQGCPVFVLIIGRGILWINEGFKRVSAS